MDSATAAPTRARTGVASSKAKKATAAGTPPAAPVAAAGIPLARRPDVLAGELVMHAATLKRRLQVFEDQDVNDGQDGDWSDRLSRMAGERFETVRLDAENHGRTTHELFDVRSLLTGAAAVEGISAERRMMNEVALVSLDAMTEILFALSDDNWIGVRAHLPRNEPPQKPRDEEHAQEPRTLLHRQVTVILESIAGNAHAVSALCARAIMEIDSQDTADLVDSARIIADQIGMLSAFHPAVHSSVKSSTSWLLPPVYEALEGAQR